MISFWPLLHPLMDGGGTAMWHLAHRLLSTWEWSSATHPTSCPPAPTNMEIGQWLPLDRDNCKGSREDLWIEAYACCLQCIAEASTGWSWVTEGEGMAPCVSPLTQVFLSTAGRRISPAILWECWPPKHDIVPRQPMSEIRAHITHCLDQVATQSPSNIAWDIFTWPDTNKDCWGEDCLPYSPGSTGGFEFADAGDLIGAPWWNRQIPGSGLGAEVQGTYVGLWPTNEWHGVGSDERYTFFAHGGQVVVSEWPGQLLSHPLHSVSRPDTPWGTPSWIHTDWSLSI